MKELILISDLISAEALSWINNVDILKDINTLKRFYCVIFSMTMKEIRQNWVGDTEHCVFCGFFDLLEKWKDQKDPNFDVWHTYAIELIPNRNKCFNFHTYYNDIVNEIQFAVVVMNIL